MTKRIILLASLLIPFYSFSCDCVPMSFCFNQEETPEVSVFMVEIVDTFYQDDLLQKYYDVPVIKQLFGPAQSLDSLTILYGTSSCDADPTIFADTMIIKMWEFEKDETSNHPIFSFFSCRNYSLQFRNDSIIGNFTEVDTFTFYIPAQKLPYSEFLSTYEQECSLTASLPDLEELKGVEIIQNPVYSSLNLRNNLDKPITFSIYDSIGRFLGKGVVNGNTVYDYDVSYLPNAVYYVRLDDGIGPKFHKVLKL